MRQGFRYSSHDCSRHRKISNQNYILHANDTIQVPKNFRMELKGGGSAVVRFINRYGRGNFQSPSTIGIYCVLGLFLGLLYFFIIIPPYHIYIVYVVYMMVYTTCMPYIILLFFLNEK